jgi:alpha-galactosidase
VTDAFVRASAEALISSGLAKKGYKYVNVDEGWLKGRSPNGTIYEDLEKFPHGMKGLGDWVTSQAVAEGSDEKLVYGLYSCRGTHQCGTSKYGATGSNGHEAADTQWMIDAGARWLKIDSCSASGNHSIAYSDYSKFRDAMNKSGEHVWFNLCGWHEWYAPPDPALNFGGGQTLGNSYRISGDGGSWGAITQALNTMAQVVQYNHLGGYADPDNILGPHGTVGRVTESQARVQMVLWSLMPTQLILGEDITKMSDEYIATVGNEELIAVNQDAPLAGSATRIVGGDLKFPCIGNSVPAAINWTNTSASVPIPSLLWELEGGAASTGSKLAGQTDIRSGGPGQTTMAVVEQPLASLGHTITSVSVSFQYISGYGCLVGDCAGAANLSLAVVDAANHTIVARIWDSPALNNASYDAFTGYSKPVTGSVTGLSLSWPRKTQLALLMHNNKRNLQIPMSSVKLSISWGQGGAGAWNPAPKSKDANAVCENIWSRPLANGDVALAMVNQGGNASMVCNATCFALAGLAGAKKLKVRDMIAHADLPELSPPFALTAFVAGQGAAAAFRLTPVK